MKKCSLKAGSNDLNHTESFNFTFDKYNTEVKMKKKLVWLFQLIIISTILISFAGCDKDDDDSPNMDFKYPLTVGNSWDYELLFIDDYDSLAESIGYCDDTLNYTASVEIISNEMIFDSIETFNFKIIEEVYAGIYQTNEYYNNIAHNFINYGYTSGSMITPKIDQQKQYIVFNDIKFDNILELSKWITNGSRLTKFTKDSIIYDPVNTLVYPLEEGRTWIYREPNQPFGIDKKIIGTEIISTSAGEFNCWKIEWIYTDSLFQDIEFFDYIAEEGLVRRIIKSQFYIANEIGEIIGTSDFIEEQILVDFIVK